MTRDELRNLGLTSEQVDAIMSINGKDIEAAKKDGEALRQQTAAKDSEIEGLKAQITQRDKDIAELKKDAAGNAELQTKLSDLQTRYDSDTQSLQKQLKDQQTEFTTSRAMDKFFADVEFSSNLAREAAMAQFKAKGLKLDGESFQGGKEWLETLRKENPDAFKAEPQPESNANGKGLPTFTNSFMSSNNGGTLPQQSNNNTGNFGGWNFTVVRNPKRNE